MSMGLAVALILSNKAGASSIVDSYLLVPIITVLSRFMPSVSTLLKCDATIY